jgi:hypothetical protein
MLVMNTLQHRPVHQPWVSQVCRHVMLESQLGTALWCASGQQLLDQMVLHLMRQSQQMRRPPCCDACQQLLDLLWQSCARICESFRWNSPPQKTPCYGPARLTTTPSPAQEALARPRACVLSAHGWTAQASGWGLCVHALACVCWADRAKACCLCHGEGARAPACKRGSALRETARQGARQ